MVKLHPLSWILLFCTCVCCNVFALEAIGQRLEQQNSFCYETAFSNFRNQEISVEEVNQLMKAVDNQKKDFCELLTMYYSEENNFDFLIKTDETPEINERALEQISFARQYQTEDFEKIEQAVQAVWMDAVCFPVGAVEAMPNATVFFANSWMQSRTYGGERWHEGTDIMASVNERGIYPVYSMSEGVVEKIGWLPLGGYRIGVRSPSGGYFYYAHLAEYAKDFIVGEQVGAGQCLGFMGDTGYSEIEGTTGNFDVHLHLGIYVTIDGVEYSVNSYPVLAMLAQDSDIVKRWY